MSNSETSDFDEGGFKVRSIFGEGAVRRRSPPPEIVFADFDLPSRGRFKRRTGLVPSDHKLL
jgi:hypothetical protein